MINKKIIVLSNSEIKKKAVLETFDDKYKINFVEIPDDINRDSQPIYNDGTKKAIMERIKIFVANNKINEDEIIIVIENGITNIDVKNKNSTELCDYNWADFCMFGIMINNNIEYLCSPMIINIDKKETDDYFKNYYLNNNGNNENNGNNGNNIDTLGKYLANKYENVSHNNWMKKLALIDRVDQIKCGLKLLLKKYDL